MQLDVDDIASALILTEHHEDAAMLHDVEFLGMNKLFEFVYKATWHVWLFDSIPVPGNIYVSLLYSSSNIDYYVHY